MNIYITGIGCISPIGNNKNENLNSLRRSSSGLKKTILFESKFTENFVFGEVNLDNETIMSVQNIKDIKGLTRTDLLAIKAFDDAVIDAGLTEKEIASNDTAFISASTVGGMCLTNRLYDDSNLKSETKEFLESYSCSAHTLKICKKYKIKGLVNTINSACSSSANSILYGARLIKSGRAKRAIVGGVDSLSKYTANGFNSLQILSDEKCRPFDENRKGLNIGEGAGYIVLEAESIIKNKNTYAKFTGYGNSNDAFHTSSMSENAKGIKIAINEALEIAGISPEKIDYINAHGTGTLNNDFVELTGFKDVFGKVPPFSSTKSFTGHTLGAAGVIEAIFSVFSIFYGELYPNLNLKTPMKEFDIQPITEFTDNKKINSVMSNSYGFSGNCTSLIFERT